MKSVNSSFPRFRAGLIAGSLIAFVLAGIAVKAFRRPSVPPKPVPPLLKLGFDFRALRSGEKPWKGPAIGDKIDMTKLKALDGSGISALVGKQPVMLASINPACGMCTAARDEMFFIREHLTPVGVQYYAVCFRPIDSSQNFYRYAASLGLSDPTFEWQGAESPSRAILDMTVPSHLLVDSQGIVLQVWPGSSEEKEVRQRMGSQIVDDTLLISETLRVGVSDSTKDMKPFKTR
jgi:hypothetical protein